MSIYYTGITLPQVLTGFGGYTGLTVVNSGNFAVKYTATVSDTTLKNLTSSDIAAGANKNTIYISEDLSNVDINDSDLEFQINPSESKKIYILHRPFKDFAGGFTPIAGDEVAKITIDSVSSYGDIDKQISIDVTGKRIITYSTPPRIGSFFAVSDYDPSTSIKFYRSFFWNVITQNAYFTSFDLQLSTNTAFSAPATYSIDVVQNTDANLPLYGTYQGLYNNIYNYDIKTLTAGQDYYARIRGVNVSSQGAYSYCTGFDSYNVTLDGTGYSGLYPTPGGNLKVDYQSLNLVRFDTYEEDFDLYEYIINQNNGSTDFTRYSGINIKFFSNNLPNLCRYVAKSTDKGAINFNIPVSAPIQFSAGAGNIFRIEMEFENCALYGKGGDGLKWINDGNSSVPAYVDPKDGGPILNLDTYSYNGIPIQYNIYKDINSVFYAGPGGSKGWVINVDGDQDIDKTIFRINGGTIEYLSEKGYG